MIKKIECYVPVCDICEKLADGDADFIIHYDTETEALEGALEDENYGGTGCREIDGKLCCTGCWTYDDDDNVVIRA